MSRIPLTGGFSIIPEGRYVFRIYDVVHDETFGKIEVKLVNAKGQTHTERFSIKNADDSYNEGALNAFSYLAKNALNDFAREEVDPVELINCFVEAEVVHTKVQSKQDPSKFVTFANLGDKSPAQWFDTPPVPKATEIGSKPLPKQKEEPEEKVTTGLDLDALLGG